MIGRGRFHRLKSMIFIRNEKLLLQIGKDAKCIDDKHVICVPELIQLPFYKKLSAPQNISSKYLEKLYVCTEFIFPLWKSHIPL